MRDLTNLRFGILTVVRFSKRIRSAYYWVCKCDCGTVKEINSAGFKYGGTVSCGCKRESSFGLISKTHGMRKTPEYGAWRAMINRCADKSHKNWANYGGKGVYVCADWVSSFEAFYLHIGPRPTPSHSLDRIDNDGNYEPGNVRWATRKEQNNNKSTNRIIIFNGEHITVANFSELINLPYEVVYYRAKRGWSAEKIASTPIREFSNRSAQVKGEQP